MKPFNLEEYLKNPLRKIVTRDGREVTRILCTDAKSKNYPIIALIKSQNEEEEYPIRYTVNGQYCPDYKLQYDLFFAPEEHEKWINIYRDTTGVSSGEVLYDSRVAAEEVGKICKYYVATVKVEWEE